MSELKPCPFCRYRDKLSSQQYPGCKNVESIYCDRCGTFGPGEVDEIKRAETYISIPEIVSHEERTSLREAINEAVRSGE